MLPSWLHAGMRAHSFMSCPLAHGMNCDQAFNRHMSSGKAPFISFTRFCKLYLRKEMLHQLKALWSVFGLDPLVYADQAVNYSLIPPFYLETVEPTLILALMTRDRRWLRPTVMHIPKCWSRNNPCEQPLDQFLYSSELEPRSAPVTPAAWHLCTRVGCLDGIPLAIPYAWLLFRCCPIILLLVPDNRSREGMCGGSSKWVAAAACQADQCRMSAICTADCRCSFWTIEMHKSAAEPRFRDESILVITHTVGHSWPNLISPNFDSKVAADLILPVMIGTDAHYWLSADLS